jgi:hypothetical protein
VTVTIITKWLSKQTYVGGASISAGVISQFVFISDVSLCSSQMFGRVCLPRILLLMLLAGKLF